MSSASTKTITTGRRVAILGVVALFVLSAFFVLAPTEDADASMTTETVKSPIYTTERTQVMYDDSDYPIGTFTLTVTSTQAYVELDDFTGWPQYISWQYYRDGSPAGGATLHTDNVHSSALVTAYIGLEDDQTTGRFEVWGTYEDDYSKVPECDVLNFEFDLTTKTVYKYTTSVSYDLNGGTGSFGPDSVTETLDNQSSKEVSFTIPSSVPTRTDGYVFDCWLDEDGVRYEAGSEIDVKIGDEVVLTASWIVPSSTITFWSNGSVYTSQTVDTGSTATPPEEPKIEGKVFLGWYTDEDCTEPFDWTSKINADIDLYAGWEDELIFTTDPVADGTVTKVDGVDGTYLFQVAENTNSERVLWDFGDGTTSSQRTVTHYFEPGEHTVTLTVYNSQGEDTEEFHLTVYGDDGGDTSIVLIVAVILVVVIVSLIVVRVVM